jgi:hypothetical protein
MAKSTKDRREGCTLLLLRIRIYTIALFVIIASSGYCMTAAGFVADSMTFHINERGDAEAVFRFTLEGLIENAIPDSMLESELRKGLTTNPDSPPTLISFTRERTVLFMPGYALIRDNPEGREYVTAPINFTRAEAALKQSALNYIIKADFSPSVIEITFPDGYQETFRDTAVLSSVTHLVRTRAEERANTSPTGALAINSTPSGALITIDGVSSGTTPKTLAGLSAGNHLVNLTKNGYCMLSSNVTVERNTTAHVMIVLSPVTPAIAPPTYAPGFDLLASTTAFSGMAAVFSKRK